MATLPITPELPESEREFDFPQREAAFFYGLFLRGCTAEQIRQDISVPPEVLAKWHREAERQPEQRPVFERIVDYRRRVLAIFESLLDSEAQSQRIQ